MDFTASSDVTIKPENAKSLNEIQEIQIVAGVVGSITYNLKRKIERVNNMSFENQLEKVIIKARCDSCGKDLDISVGSIYEASSDLCEDELCECGDGSLHIIGVEYIK